MAPPRLKEVPNESVSTGNGNLERWKFAFQVLAVVFIFISLQASLMYFVWTSGTAYGIDKEKMRAIEQRQLEEAAEKERQRKLKDVDKDTEIQNLKDELKNYKKGGNR